MKNLLLCLLLPCMFLLGNSSFGNDGILGEDGYEAVILNGKTGNPIFSFTIPNQYLGKGGNLILPIEITISQGNKKPVFSTKSLGLNVIIPIGLSGNYKVNAKIGDYSFTESIKL